MGLVDGKVALITGGARGQGRSHALTLAREGADIVVTDLAEDLPTVIYPLATEGELNETAELVRAEGQRCLAIKADAADAEQMANVVSQTLAEFGQVDIVLANAGIASWGKTWEATQEQWDEMIRVNLTGVWQTAKAAVPAMLERDNGGSIILTSSVSGLMGNANAVAYVAAKHGVIGLMRCLALEVADKMIRVNALCPGNVDTPMINNQPSFEFFAERFAGGAVEPTFEALRDALAEWHKLPVPMMDAQDVSNAVLYLSSDLARYVTGVAFPVDAGYLMK